MPMNWDPYGERLDKFAGLGNLYDAVTRVMQRRHETAQQRAREEAQAALAALEDRRVREVEGAKLEEAKNKRAWDSYMDTLGAEHKRNELEEKTRAGEESRGLDTRKFESGVMGEVGKSLAEGVVPPQYIQGQLGAAGLGGPPGPTSRALVDEALSPVGALAPGEEGPALPAAPPRLDTIYGALDPALGATMRAQRSQDIGAALGEISGGMPGMYKGPYDAGAAVAKRLAQVPGIDAEKAASLGASAGQHGAGQVGSDERSKRAAVVVQTGRGMTDERLRDRDLRNDIKEFDKRLKVSARASEADALSKAASLMESSLKNPGAFKGMLPSNVVGQYVKAIEGGRSTDQDVARLTPEGKAGLVEKFVGFLQGKVSGDSFTDEEKRIFINTMRQVKHQSETQAASALKDYEEAFEDNPEYADFKNTLLSQRKQLFGRYGFYRDRGSYGPARKGRGGKGGESKKVGVSAGGADAESRLSEMERRYAQ